MISLSVVEGEWGTVAYVVCVCVVVEGIISVHSTFTGVMISELIMLESLARDLVGQVLHVFLHLKSHSERHACDYLTARQTLVHL